MYLLDCGIKATASATLTVHERAGDASLPGAGPSAVSEMVRLLERLEHHESPIRIPQQLAAVLDVLGGEGSDEQRLARARAAHPGLDRILGALTGTVIHPTIAEAPGPHNAIADRAIVTLACIVLPETTTEGLEAELRGALGDGRYDLDVVAPTGGSMSDPDTPLRTAIESFLAEHDPEARLVPAMGYGYSDCDAMRTHYGAITYGFIPFRFGDPMVNLTTKHGPDERVLIDDLVFQTQAAIAIARSIGVLQRIEDTAVTAAP